MHYDNGDSILKVQSEWLEDSELFLSRIRRYFQVSSLLGVSIFL